MDALDTYGLWRDIVPDPETGATLLVRQPGSAQNLTWSYSLPFAKRKKLTRSVIGVAGLDLAQAWIPWQLWQEWLDTSTPLAGAPSPCPAPKKGDLIQDAGGVGFVIEKVVTQLFGNVFDCFCLRKV